MAFNVALVDFLHPPEISEIDVSGYTGKAGGTIRARALDDVQVKTVQFMIATSAGELVESGAGTFAGGLWWTYTTTQAAPNFHVKVLVVAQDIPGHTAQAEKEL